MLTVSIGNDKPAILNFIKSRRTSYKPESVIELVENNAAQIKDLFYSTSLFKDKRLVILRPSSISQIDLDEETLKEIRLSDNFELFVDASRLNKKNSAYKKLKKHAIVREFSLPKEYSHFDLIDAMFISRNKRVAMRSLAKIKKLENVSPLLVVSFQNALRNFISMKEDNKTWKSLHPYAKKKTKQFRISKDQAVKMYKELILIDLKSKTSGANLRALWEDFVLYFH